MFSLKKLQGTCLTLHGTSSAHQQDGDILLSKSRMKVTKCDKNRERNYKGGQNQDLFFFFLNKLQINILTICFKEHSLIVNITNQFFSAKFLSVLFRRLVSKLSSTNKINAVWIDSLNYEHMVAGLILS